MAAGGGVDRKERVLEMFVRVGWLCVCGGLRGRVLVTLPNTCHLYANVSGACSVH